MSILMVQYHHKMMLMLLEILHCVTGLQYFLFSHPNPKQNGVTAFVLVCTKQSFQDVTVNSGC